MATSAILVCGIDDEDELGLVEQRPKERDVDLGCVVSSKAVL